MRRARRDLALGRLGTGHGPARAERQRQDDADARDRRRQIVESGSITVLGEPAGTPPLRWKVGYMTQNPAVYGDLTVRENLHYFARILAAAPENVDEVLEMVNMTAFGDRVVNRLSGGQRARVSLATALIGSRNCSSPTSPRSGSTRCSGATFGERSTTLPAKERRCSSRAT